MRTSRWLRLLAVLLGLSLIAAACGDDDDSADDGTDQSTDDGDADAGDDATTDDDDDETTAGGELINFGTFVGDPPEHLDPALNSTLNAYQVINAIYDGLTDIDATDPENPKIVPHLAEDIEPNDDATVWTFTIKEDLAFSNGEAIVPSTFKRSWERAATMAGDYSYLIGAFIEGGSDALDGSGELTGVVADDDAMTLTVTLTEPYANFDAVAGFQLFMPVPEEAGDGAAPVEDYENGIMVGNGPYAMESARSDEEIVIVKSDSWTGDYNGDTWDDRLDRIIFRTQADPDTAYNAFEAGEAQIGIIPPGRTAEARENYGNTTDVGVLGTYHFVFRNTGEGPLVGDENIKLRQAISAAVDREEINVAVYDGTRTVSTGVTPPGIPGFEAGLCDVCTFDADRAKTLYDEWVAEGGELDGPIPIQFNADAGHEPVVAIMIDNLSVIGIEAIAQPTPSETYFSGLAGGGCVAICRAGWFADYPTYDNFMFDLFHSSSLEGNNFGFLNEDFDALIDEAKQTTDKDAAKALYNEAEDILLNLDPGVVPVNWYNGSYVYDQETVKNFTQTNFGLILWEQIRLAA